MLDKVDNPYRELTDDSLIGRASVSGATQGALVGEVIRRLKESVDEQNKASTQLAKRIEKLNVWLLWVTVAIGAMTLVQVALTFAQLYAAYKK